jgi:Polyketide cyclase / dehydrase and lipid transport
MKNQILGTVLSICLLGLLAGCNSNQASKHITESATVSAASTAADSLAKITAADTITPGGPIVNGDLVHHNPAIHWPAGLSPEKADLFAHNEVSINAPCSTVWKDITEAEKWPEWYPNSSDVKVLNSKTGTLDKNSLFTWNTFGIHLDSTRVHEYVLNNRLGWFGYTNGLKAYHTWLLEDQSGGCKITMEEIGMGAGAKAMHAKDPNAMQKGHQLWDTRLKQLAEKR